MTNDTLDEIEARARFRVHFASTDQVGVDALALIAMVRARDRVVEAAHKAVQQIRVHSETCHELTDALAALDTPTEQEPTE